MRFIELFVGIGGFRLGLEPLGWKCVWANEIDPYACRVYRKNFGDKELFEGDIDWILESPNLIYSQQDSPVNHFQLPVNNSEKMTVEINGLPQSTPFAYYDQDTHSWKTFQESLALGDQRISGEYLETWPRAGMMHNGIVYRLQPSAPLTGGTGYGLLPTPTATERSGINPKTGRGAGLTKKLKLVKLPTIGVNEYKGSSRNRYKGSKDFRGAKTSEGLRTTSTDPAYLTPSFAEKMMNYPIGWTELNA